ncbi:MAG TPA: hypothetical protein PLU75_06025 [Oscillospiraceae bacterium]|nr:hypothetical protein [Oscillospiraceae bacterium]HRW57805.1 hypothetical protein [Oscillospiraceae bacterium]
MSREKENYRDELEQLLAFFGERRVLSVVDVARYTGRDPRWCKQVYDIDPQKGITVVALAKQLSD